jgi:aerobic-type carbon monoxide dehydrogenase small subunit (CoxS/CutS family)
MKQKIVSFTVNGEAREIAVAPNRSLLDALRAEAGLRAATSANAARARSSWTVAR